MVGEPAAGDVGAGAAQAGPGVCCQAIPTHASVLTKWFAPVAAEFAGVVGVVEVEPATAEVVETELVPEELVVGKVEVEGIAACGS